jgi:capsular exopolysaccharide synthesis family protein
LFLVIAAMASVAGGIGAALLVQLCRPASMSLNAIADALGIRPLVAIPRFRNASRVDGAIQIEDPRLFIESIRSVRNAVLEHPPGKPSTTCLLTSVLPRQGKSLIAMSLARSIARAGSKTLFLELDLRQPSGSVLARIEPPARGVAAVLEKRVALGDVLIRDESTGLDMLLAERNARGSLERLTTVGLAELLAKLRTRYHAIIVDSPPIGLVADALTLAGLVDQTILVARDGESSLAELARGTRLLKERGATLAGLILTGVDPDQMSSVDKATMNRYVVGVPIRAIGGGAG